MAGDNSVGSDHIHDEVQGMEVLRASLLTQETVLRALADNVDRRFHTFKERFDEIVDQLDAFEIGVNRDRNDDRQ